MQVAQLNIAQALEPLDSELLADFVAALDDINSAAERAPGFVWRLQTEDGDATGIRVDPDPLIIVNMSVWRSIELLWQFVYGPQHVAIMRRRRKWFRKPARSHSVLWWVEHGARPTVEDGMTRLALLDRDGPTPDAFTFKHAYDQAGRPVDSRDGAVRPFRAEQTRREPA